MIRYAPRFAHTLALSCLLAMAPAAQAAEKNCYHSNAAVEKRVGYCAAVRAGNTLYLSGAAAGGDMAAAAGKVYAELKKTLEDNGLGFADVVKENVYATDLDAFIRYQEQRKAVYGNALPAATWVQVQRLYNPSLVLEIELIAVYPK